MVKVHESSLHRLVTHIDAMFDRAQLPLKLVDASELSSTTNDATRNAQFGVGKFLAQPLITWYLIVDLTALQITTWELNGIDAIVPAPIRCFPMLQKGIEDIGTIWNLWTNRVPRQFCSGKVQPQLLRLHRAVCQDQLAACAKRQKENKKKTLRYKPRSSLGL